MKHRIFWPALVVAGYCLTLGSCSSGSDNLTRLLAERDSLIDVTRTQGERIELFNKAVETINTAVDSISEQEGLLFFPTDPEGKYSKDDALKDLENYELVLKRQHEKIEELRAGLKLTESGDDLKGMVEVMQQQLRAKDAMIAQLRSQLAEKELDIARLRRTVESQQLEIGRQGEEIADLGRRMTAKDKALENQDRILNQCYVIIASKSDLQRRGILKKGKLVAEGMLNKSSLMKVDIRKAKEFAFAAKKPRILTNMPSSAYRLTTAGDGNFILNITNPTDFWSLSSVLVIQTD